MHRATRFPDPSGSGSACRPSLKQCIDTLRVEAVYGFTVDHDYGCSHRTHLPKFLDCRGVSGDVPFGDFHALSRKILLRALAGRSARLGIDDRTLANGGLTHLALPAALSRLVGIFPSPACASLPTPPFRDVLPPFRRVYAFPGGRLQNCGRQWVTFQGEADGLAVPGGVIDRQDDLHCPACFGTVDPGLPVFFNGGNEV